VTINFESLNNWNTAEQNPEREIIDDGILGKTIHFKGAERDASDFDIVGAANTGSVLIVKYIPLKEFRMYAKINMISEDKKDFKIGYIHFSHSLEKPINIFGDDEWSYPVNFRIIANTWFISSLNLKKATKDTFGKDGWKFKEIRGIRIRGTGQLNAIMIR